MKLFWLSLALFYFVKSFGAPPIVYTGVFTNHITGTQQNARLTLTANFKPDQKSPLLTATVTLYFGQENSREYITLFYDPVIIVPNSKEIFLTRDDDGRARRLPNIRLKFNDNDTEAEGTLFSHTEGSVGTLHFKLGWETIVQKPLTELGGIYDADCGPSDGSNLVLRDVEIVPSRILADKTFPESALGTMNYIGNGSCHRNYGFVSCVNFNPGLYNFYTGKLILHQGSWLWNCEREGNDALKCSSPRYRVCRLEKARKLPMPDYPFIKRPEPRPIPWSDFEPPSKQGTCSDWEGQFHGPLTHFLGGRQQLVSLKLVSIPLAKNPEKCLLNGTAHLYFQNGSKLSSKIAFPLVNVEILSSEKHIVLQSDVYTDLVLEIERTENSTFTGNWISRLYGTVGNFELTKNEQVKAVPEELAVQDISGEFTWGEKKNWLLSLNSIESGLDKSSYDPYSQLKITGSLIMQGDFNHHLHPFRVGGMGSSSYDYFTNTLVLRSGSILSGHIDRSGVYLRGISSGYLNYAPDRALWIPRFFERMN